MKVLAAPFVPVSYTHLFEDAPLFTVVSVVQRNGALEVSGVPVPPYAMYPVTAAGEQPAQAALDYAQQLFSGMLYNGTGLSLSLIHI